MALTLNVSPTDYNLSKSPMWAKITTDNYVINPGIPASLYLNADNSDPNAVGGTIKLVWPLGSITMTIVSGTPDDSGFQLPPKGAQTDTAYATILAIYLKKNYLLIHWRYVLHR